MGMCLMTALGPYSDMAPGMCGTAVVLSVLIPVPGQRPAAALPSPFPFCP